MWWKFQYHSKIAHLNVFEENVDTERFTCLGLRDLPIRNIDALIIVKWVWISAHFVRQKLQEILHKYTTKFRFTTYHDPIRVNYNHVCLLEQQWVAHGAVVVEDGSSEDVSIGRLHYFKAIGRADSSPICSNETRVCLRNLTFGGWHSGVCISTCFRQFVERSFRFS